MASYYGFETKKVYDIYTIKVQKYYLKKYVFKDYLDMESAL